MAFAAIAARAEKVTAPGNTGLDEIVVTAKRRSDPAADEKTKQQVEEALHSDPFFYDEHVTVTISNGIITIHGVVFDDWDLRNAVRISRKIPGVKRVVNDLEIMLGGE
jgi:osmotically-inducible protein OsmY